MSKSYLSNLSYAQYELLSDLLPQVKPGGRMQGADLWEVLNPIF